MSLFGAMSTAISGLGAQSSAFGNISDNVANSQTLGYKRVDTSFIDYLTSSTPQSNESGAVVARPDYVNTVQGTISQTDNPLGLAIAGQGFFAISERNGETNGLPSFSPQQFFTRAGDFQLDRNGYLKNSSGGFLNGWTVDPSTGVADRNAISPVQVSQTVFAPVATSTVTLSANLPATPAPGTATPASPISSQIQIYDGLGTQHIAQLDWVKTGAATWTVNVVIPDDPSASGAATVDFAGDGTILAVNGSGTPGAAAFFGFTSALPGIASAQVNIGTFGQAGGLTQFAGTAYSLRGLAQNGIPAGSFNGIALRETGDVVVNYDNGQSRTIARVPVFTFNNPDGLQRQDGQAFTATIDSGAALAVDAGTNGAGNLVAGAVESSNVDIAAEFTKLIVAQRAYSANTKVVTSADDLLQQTIDMKR